MSASTPSINYLIARDPKRFGPLEGAEERQAAYEKRAEEITQSTTESLQLALARGDDLTDVFHAQIETLSQIRHQMAIDQGCKDPEDFGHRRDRFPSSAFLSGLPIGGVYKEYEPKIRKLFSSVISLMQQQDGQFNETYKRKDLPDCKGYKNWFECRIFESKDTKSWNIQLTEENYRRIYALLDLPIPLEPFSADNSYAWLDNILKYEPLQKLKKVSIEDYEKLMRLHWISYHEKTWSCKEICDCAELTLQFQIGEIALPLTRFVTRICQSPIFEPIEMLEVYSKYMIYNQDRFDNAHFLNETAKIFAAALQWKPEEGIDLLKEHMALWNLLFRLTIPYVRGTCAIADWLEKAIYRVHGFEMEVTDPNRMIDLEANTQTPADFLKIYSELVHLTARG